MYQSILTSQLPKRNTQELPGSPLPAMNECWKCGSSDGDQDFLAWIWVWLSVQGSTLPDLEPGGKDSPALPRELCSLIDLPYPPLHVFRWLQKHRNNYTELLSWIATTALVRIIFCYWGCWFDCRYFFQPQGKIESPWLIKEDSVLWYSLSFVNFMYTHSSTEHLLIFPMVLKKLLFLHSFIYVKSPALLLYFSGFPSSHQTNLYLFLELKFP